MDSRKFFELVSQMRDAQKKYFRTRSQSALTESKSLEYKVDAEISRVREILDNEKPRDMTLF